MNYCNTNEMKKINLFCFPYAGGTQYSYAGLKKHCPPEVEWHSIDLPGRGRRISEKLLTSVHDMVRDILPLIKSKAHEPYAIYGHSMGSLLGFLITKEILKANLPPPIRLIVSGRGGPSVKKRDDMKYLLPKDQFIVALKEMGGMDDVLESEELMEFFEPILRADLEAAETYQPQPNIPFNVPITVLIGEKEEVTEEEGKAWQLETTLPIEYKCFPGNHFFILDFEKEIMDMIAGHLLSYKTTSAN